MTYPCSIIIFFIGLYSGGPDDSDTQPDIQLAGLGIPLLNTVSCLWSHWGTRRASWTDLLLLLVESYSVTAIGFSGATTVSFASTAHVLVQLAKSKSSRTLILPCLPTFHLAIGSQFEAAVILRNLLQTISWYYFVGHHSVSYMIELQAIEIKTSLC